SVEERPDRRHAAVHGAGAGAGRGHRPARRPVQPRQRAVRHVYRPAAVPRPEHPGDPPPRRRGHSPTDPRDHPRGAALAVCHCGAASCEETGRTLLISEGGGPPPGAPPGEAATGPGPATTSRGAPHPPTPSPTKGRGGEGWWP